jgi:hypothetical protein
LHARLHRHARLRWRDRLHWHARLHLRLRAAVKLPHVVERITVWYTRIEGGDMQSRELRNFSGGAARGFVVVVLQYPDKEQCLTVN